MQSRWFALSAIVVLSTLLRFRRLDAPSLWIDEAVTVEIIRLEWSTFLNLLIHWEPNMALYHVLLRAWSAFGSSEWVFRSFSVLSAVATVPAVYALASRLSARAALPAALLLAVNPLHVHYAQEARSYALTVFLVTVASYLFVRYVQEARRLVGWWYVVVAALAVYAHVFAVLVPVGHAVSLLLWPRETWRRVALSLVAIGVLCCPLIIAILLADAGNIDWVTRPEPKDLGRVFELFAGGTALVLVCGAVAIAGFTRTRESRLLLIWTVTPILIAYAVSLTKPVFVSRYLIVALPAFVLLVAAGASALRSWGIVALATIGAFSLQALRPYYWNPREDWRAATAYVIREAQPTDAALFFIGRGRTAYDYYHTEGGPIVLFPSEPDITTHISEESQRPSAALMDLIPSEHRRAWLILSHWQLTADRRALTERMRTQLAKQFIEVQSRQFSGVRVLLYRR